MVEASNAQPQPGLLCSEHVPVPHVIGWGYATATVHGEGNKDQVSVVGEPGKIQMFFFAKKAMVQHAKRSRL